MKATVSVERGFGSNSPLPDDARIRFAFEGRAHIDVFFDPDAGYVVVHSDGFSGCLEIRPRAANEALIRIGSF